jgi:hypothetical protein
VKPLKNLLRSVISGMRGSGMVGLGMGGSGMRGGPQGRFGGRVCHHLAGDGRRRAPLICPAPPAIDPAVRDADLACEHRGPEGGLVLLDVEKACCGGGAERTACAAGKGRGRGELL